MFDFVKDPRHRVEVLMGLLNSIFSCAKTATPQGYLNREQWVEAHDRVVSLLTHVEEPSIQAALNAQAKKTLDGVLTHDEDGGPSALDIERQILPSLVSFLQNLDSELLKAFQNTAHTKFEYLQRIRDENRLLFLCDSVLSFLERYFPSEKSKQARVALLKLEHLYYKHDSLFAKFTTNQESYVPSGPSQQVIAKILQQIIAHGSSKMKVRANLCQAYHHGLHRRFHEGRELLLKTHLGETIHL